MIDKSEKNAEEDFPAATVTRKLKSNKKIKRRYKYKI